MAGAYSTVDLSQLTPPAVVEVIDYDTIVADMIAYLQARDSTFTALLESDPAYKVIEVCAYREFLLRQRVNDACYANMLAFATGSDLDQIGANFGVVRLVVVPANTTSVPPTPAVMESDTALRYRIQLSLEGYSTAGPVGAYVFHGLSADGRVKDISADSPSPGQVLITVLSNETGGVPSADVLAAVTARLNSDTIRPLTDQVIVAPAVITTYNIQAELTFYPGPDSTVITLAAIAAAQAYADSVNRLGFDVTRSGIIRALHQSGVQNVNLISPATDLVIDDGYASLCTAVNLTNAGTNV